MLFNIFDKNLEALWHILQLPWENPSYKTGCQSAPAVIEQACSSIEEYDAVTQTTISSHHLCNWEFIYTPELFKTIQIQNDVFHRKLIGIGGDHSITQQLIGNIQAYRNKPLQVFYLDAHADLRDSYVNVNAGWDEQKSSKVSHACTAKRLLEMGVKVCFEMEYLRSWSKEEYEEIFLLNTYLDKNKPFWISLDLDWLDPLQMQAVSNPEPEGGTWKELYGQILPLLSLPSCLGIDIVEYNPSLDPSGVFGVYIAHLLKKILLSRRT